MANQRLGKLRRLVRVADLLSRLQEAELARLRFQRAAVDSEAADAARWLDTADLSALFLTDVAIGRAAGLRTDLGQMDELLATQLEAAQLARAGLKGADSQLALTRAEVGRSKSRQELEAAVVRSTGASLVQGRSAIDERGVYVSWGESESPAGVPPQSIDISKREAR